MEIKQKMLWCMVLCGRCACAYQKSLTIRHPNSWCTPIWSPPRLTIPLHSRTLTLRPTEETKTNNNNSQSSEQKKILTNLLGNTTYICSLSLSLFVFIAFDCRGAKGNMEWGNGTACWRSYWKSAGVVCASTFESHRRESAATQQMK